ncbi:hypothetical protein OG689_42530 [Kitasatospora sp. NBC_00240]|uniref:hypothetical protein n=1 Tax=Kitasatospora sp. NBC_00240 TaxID=2903567 RepID=UPI002252522D|nr:hypothetical protein [Kitasatospora sp. NBC_00240]MCX5215829.1 hypothetical protein [Kitasatospora sp. NBC_00240]
MARSRDLRTLTDTVEPVAGMMPVPVARRAIVVVASYARDADDCRRLLRALGLIPEEEQVGEEQRAAASRACVGCGRPFDHPGVRRRDRFCSVGCYRSGNLTAR